MASCERDDLDVAVEKERIGNEDESSGLMLDKCREGPVNVGFTSSFWLAPILSNPA
jgi:hypothetical protein